LEDVSIKLTQVPELNKNIRIVQNHSPSSSSTSVIDLFTKVMFFLPSDVFAELWHARKSAWRYRCGLTFIAPGK
jgi:hypothetical protein